MATTSPSGFSSITENSKGIDGLEAVTARASFGVRQAAPRDEAVASIPIVDDSL